MSTGEWLTLAGVLVAALSGMYAIIMKSVDGKIADAMNKLKDDRIRELLNENYRLKDGIKDMK